MTTKDLQQEEYNEYYALYVDQVATDRDLLTALRLGRDETVSFFKELPEGKWDYAYDTGKWTPKEVLLHLIDTERIFSYRALRFARKDATNLPGFDQNEYVEPSGAKQRTVDSLLKEYSSVRESSIALFENLDENMLAYRGLGSGNVFSARALGFINAGHEIHHKRLITERYLD